MDIVIKFKCPLSQKKAVCNQQRSFWQRGFVNLQGVRRTKNVHFDITWGICFAFHKQAHSKVQKPPSQSCFSLPSIILNTQNGSKPTNHRSQTMTFWTRLSKVLFFKRSTRMTDGSKECKRQLAFRLRVRMYLKSAATRTLKKVWIKKKT